MLESVLGMSYFIFILNIDHNILFAAKMYILQLILHGLNYKLARVPHFSAILRYNIPRGYSVAHSTFMYQLIFYKSLIFEFSTLFYIRTHLQTFWTQSLD